MADTAAYVTARNGLSHAVQLLHRDARRLGAPRDVAGGPAQLLVFEIFDCGLIGEGALHIVAAARQHLAPGGRILPASAKVFCQPIQFGGHHREPHAAHPLAAFDTSPLHPYSWRGDEYAEVDLTAAESAWTPAAPPQLAFEWDFNARDPLTAFAPAAKQLAFAVEARATVNAVAFWFELTLDEHTRLTSSPYACQPVQPATTWKQAVQLLPEHIVQPGQQLTLVASHDTYAISFQVQPPAEDQGPSPTGVPLFDAAWRAAYEQLGQLQAQLAKAITQDPLEHRRVVEAALSLVVDGDEAGGGARADPHHAAALLTRLMA